MGDDRRRATASSLVPWIWKQYPAIETFLAI